MFILNHYQIMQQLRGQIAANEKSQCNCSN